MSEPTSDAPVVRVTAADAPAPAPACPAADAACAEPPAPAPACPAADAIAAARDAWGEFEMSHVFANARPGSDVVRVCGHGDRGPRDVLERCIDEARQERAVLDKLWADIAPSRNVDALQVARCLASRSWRAYTRLNLPQHCDAFSAIPMLREDVVLEVLYAGRAVEKLIAALEWLQVSMNPDGLVSARALLERASVDL